MDKEQIKKERREPLADTPADDRPVISAQQRGEIFEVISKALSIADEASFSHWAENELRHIFPYGMMACMMGRIEGNGAHILHFSNVDFPAEYFRPYQRANGFLSDPIIARWIELRQPVLYQPGTAFDTLHPDAPWRENFERHGLSNIAAHGQSDIDSQTTSYFLFSGIPDAVTSWHAHLLRLLMPQMHLALSRLLESARTRANREKSMNYRLTDREVEVLHWLCSGKTNEEISQVLSISTSTVKNHIHRILNELNVSSRTQAVAKALQLKLTSRQPD